jgi:thiamine pyrophosphate-dependent acetolactate synthase large subunit-like protein
VTSTLMGLGAFPADHPDWLGMLGMHGTYEANLAMNQCDVMVNIGARFDDRVTGRLDAFSPGSSKIHIDIDRSSINKVIPVDLGIVGDCADRARAADRRVGQPQEPRPRRMEGAHRRLARARQPRLSRRSRTGSCRSSRCSGCSR